MAKPKWNLQEMQQTLVKDAEQNIEQGFKKLSEEQAAAQAVAAPSVAMVSQPTEAEPTKGVQTYIPMSMYRRLNDIKLTRRQNIADLVSQAIELWLDVQEGPLKVEKVI